MKSTDGELSSAAVPGLYVLFDGDVNCSTGAAFSRQMGMLNIS